VRAAQLPLLQESLEFLPADWPGTCPGAGRDCL